MLIIYIIYEYEQPHLVGNVNTATVARLISVEEYAMARSLQVAKVEALITGLIRTELDW